MRLYGKGGLGNLIVAWTCFFRIVRLCKDCLFGAALAPLLTAEFQFELGGPEA